MGVFTEATMVAYAAAAVNIVFLLYGSALLFILCKLIKNQTHDELAKTLSLLERAPECISYAQIPMAALGALCTQMQIPIEDVINVYLKEAAQRRNIVYQIFHKDKITDEFLTVYTSKFMASGYFEETVLSS